jgi:xylan 1,4-beta-xylosidase
MKCKLAFSAVFLFLGLCSLISNAQGLQKQTTICNPLNLSYRFQLSMPSRREAADPSVISFKGKYFMFASKTGGYWVSDNLTNWKLITSNDLPWEDYAPTAVVMGDTVYFMALDRRIYKSGDPLSGRWQIAKDSFPVYTGDPALFQDDDGRLYLYHGLSPVQPIKGMELDRKTFDPIGEQVACLNTKPDDHGWERRGDYNTDKGKPFLEGAWMTKYKGKYYLQYSAPGTQFKSYSDGVYIGDAPLGPFKLAAHNPFSYKPEGFIASAGHSSTFQDRWGNYWHAATMTISVKEKFERRLGLFPAFFDSDGTFYTYTGFGDFPHKVPEKRMKGPEDFQPSSMLLSYNKPVEVSSAAAEHPKEHATDENIRTWWSAETGNKGEWLMMDLQKACSVSAVQLNYADEATKLFGRSDAIYYQYLLEYSMDKKTWKKLVDKTNNKTDVPHDYVELPTPVTARYIRLTNYHVPDGKFAVSGLRVFGKGNGQLPPAVSSFEVSRDTADGCNVTLKWPMSDGATGYNIRYGTKPEKLYHNYQVFDTNTLTIHSLNRLQQYYFAIDAFNENGITKGTVVKGDGNREVAIK